LLLFDDIVQMKVTTRRRLQGASVVEYALLLALIAIIAIAGIQFLGRKTADKLCETGGTLQHEGNSNYRYNPATGKCEVPGFEN
jgi:Flp pilus assembly pilin Flp